MLLQGCRPITFNKRREDGEVNQVAGQPVERNRPMTNMEMLEQLKYLSNPERPTVIETATRLIREDLTAQQGDARAEKNRRLREAAMALKTLYEPGGELTEWTSLDAEEILDDYAPKRSNVLGSEGLQRT